MKTLKRWGILTLCALLLTGLLTVPAQADSAVPETGKAMIGENQYNTLVEAIDAAQDGDTIVLGEGLYTTYKAASPDANCQGLFYQIQKEVTFCAPPRGAGAEFCPARFLLPSR